ncbi:DUF4870 domain-containing protein [Paenibacillus thailandensis]|uniref:DUF4870 domain-containing protein n=1 Tax=Paenibacillus thailandensis TaxID=393250 RepID=A0ABW5R0F3_9BACL
MAPYSFRPDPSSTGIDPKTAGLLCYLFWFVTGIVFLIAEKQSRFVKFHALQSIAASFILMGVHFLFGWIPLIGAIVSFILWPVTVVLWIALMALALQGKAYKLPIIGEWSEQQVDKFN